MQTNNQSSAKNILIATGLAFVIACALLVTAILPAEFNIDPLGTGKLLGIAGMSEDDETTVGALNKQELDYFPDTYTVILEPFESLEFKYRLSEGATMLFKWQSTGEVFFDMHSEKDGVSPEEYSPSFDQRQSDKEYGSYTAPFTGIHGWYWENRNSSAITITLNASGFFTQATEFRDGFENHRNFQ